MQCIHWSITFITKTTWLPLRKFSLFDQINQESKSETFKSVGFNLNVKEVLGKRRTHPLKIPAIFSFFPHYFAFSHTIWPNFLWTIFNFFWTPPDALSHVLAFFPDCKFYTTNTKSLGYVGTIYRLYSTENQAKQENGLNPGVTYLDWKRSSGWSESWEGLLLVTDVSTTCAEAIFRVKW